MAEELEGHLEMHIQDNLRRGMTPEAARRDALIKLGGIELTKERYRDRRGIPGLETLLQDVRFGAAHAPQKPRLHGGCGDDPGARDRRQYRDFQFAGLRRAALSSRRAP